MNKSCTSWDIAKAVNSGIWSAFGEFLQRLFFTCLIVYRSFVFLSCHGARVVPHKAVAAVRSSRSAPDLGIAFGGNQRVDLPRSMEIPVYVTVGCWCWTPWSVWSAWSGRVCPEDPRTISFTTNACHPVLLSPGIKSTYGASFPGYADGHPQTASNRCQCLRGRIWSHNCACQFSVKCFHNVFVYSKNEHQQWFRIKFFPSMVPGRDVPCPSPDRITWSGTPRHGRREPGDHLLPGASEGDPVGVTIFCSTGRTVGR